MASDFGSGLGGLIGGAMAHDTLGEGMMTVRGLGDQAGAVMAPFVGFGQSFMQPASEMGSKLSSTAGKVPQFQDFMKDFKMSEGGKYALGQTLEAADTSAAARGGLLSGANLRARETAANGIVSQDVAQQYGLSLQGNAQQFGQLSSAFGSLLSGVNLGSGAAGTAVGALNSQMQTQAQLAQAQAKADQSKGSGIGSMFSGIGSMAAKF
jgi:hypothetical protein